MLTQEEYFTYRAHLQQNLATLSQLEQRYMDFLVGVVADAAPQLHADFSRSHDLVPCWISYPPKQRGRAPIGDSQPWSEVGEKSLSFNLLHAIAYGKVLPCLTFFLKAVYSIHGLGEQPLEYLEVACVPNGLLMFEGPFYAQTEGLLIPGKDDKSVQESDKRTRIRLNPLASLENGWRCRQIKPLNEERTQWQVLNRPVLS